jgi:hypothetical protein
VVGRTNQIVFAEIRPLREKGVEGMEIGIFRIPATAGTVCPQAEARMKRERVKGVPSIGCSRPCRDIPIVERSPLVILKPPFNADYLLNKESPQVSPPKTVGTQKLLHEDNPE